MALDVHVAATKKKAEIKRREMQIDEELHALIFTKYSSLTKKLKLFPRLANYYGDTSFNGEDIGQLAQDARSLAEHVTEAKLQDMLGKLAAVCDKARSSEENIYLFGD